MEHHIFNPPIPYTGLIHESKFTQEKIIRIQGSSPAAAHRFNICLQCGSEIVPHDGVAMRISVQFLDGFISINSLQNGIWDEEQRGAAMPINRAENFEIILMCDHSEYKVLINGQNFFGYPQKIHCDHITHLAIDGDVSIMKISYESVGKDEIDAAALSRSSVPIGLPPKENETTVNMVDTSLLPSYESVVYDKQKQSETQPVHTNSPYPVDASYSIIPVTNYPTTGVAYSSSNAPYPVQEGIHYYSSVPPPPPGPLVPVASKPVKSRWWKTGVGAFFSAMGVIAVVVIKIMIRTYRYKNN